MSRILVTGFKPFSLLTHCTANPSEIVARELDKRYGEHARLAILSADATCLQTMASFEKDAGITGILMFGAEVQIFDLVLELEGVNKSDGPLGKLNSKIASTAAARLTDFARQLGVPAATAPITPLVYWCSER
jgi:hypothetical protein